MFAIIVINLFVAVILNGHEETSRLNEANLSDYYLEEFKEKWTKYDKTASGLIKVRELEPFLSNVKLPFEARTMNAVIMKMYLPII